MRVQTKGFLLVAVIGLAPWGAAAMDAPHDRADVYNACYYCHSLRHTLPGGGATFTSACLGCHNQSGSAFGFPWGPTDEAVPGTTGMSHSWSGAGVNPRYGADTKLSYADASLLVDGKLQCAVCHEPHRMNTPATPESMSTSIPMGEGVSKSGTYGADTGTAQLTLTVASGSKAAGFRLKIQTVTGSGGTFILSHEQGWNPDGWLNWDGANSKWVVGPADGPGRAFSHGTTGAYDVELDVTGIKVRWTSGAQVGDYWDFYVGYPFLRQTNHADAGCVMCHGERNMNHFRARGEDRYYRPNGVRKFSHPVGVGLNANGFGTDRAVILDADGTVGSSTTDGPTGTTGNPTNDLVLQGGKVWCTSCHAAHNADSNSLSVDAR